MKIQDACKVLGESGCAGFAFMYVIGKDPLLLVKDLGTLIDKNIIAKNATIKDYVGLAKFYPVNASVTSKKPDEYVGGQMYLGHFKRNGYEHFVAMKDGKVVFNSLEYSYCVELGELADIRVVTILE